MEKRKFRLWLIGPATLEDFSFRFYQELGESLAENFPNGQLELVLGATGGTPTVIATQAHRKGVFVTVVYPFLSNQELADFDEKTFRFAAEMDNVILNGTENPDWHIKIRFVARDAYELHELTKDGVPGGVLLDGNGDAGTFREVMDAWKLGLPYFFYNQTGKAGRLFEAAMIILGEPKGAVYRCATIEDIIFNLKAHFGLLSPSESPPETPADQPSIETKRPMEMMITRSTETPSEDSTTARILAEYRTPLIRRTKEVDSDLGVPVISETRCGDYHQPPTTGIVILGD